LERGDLQVALGEYRFLAGAALRAEDYALAESLISEFLSTEPKSVPLLELYGELYEEKGDSGAAAQQYARAMELLLEHPEPGMESLHEELFEKVKSLSTDAALVDRLAAKLRGESVDLNSPSKTQIPAVAVEEGAPGEVSASMAAGGFSVAGAEPDEDAWKTKSKTRPEQHGHLALDNVQPDGIRAPITGEAAVTVAPDHDAHFTLGVAYKNMGLYAEAKEEFDISKSGDAYYLDSCLMAALCYKEERQLAQAIRGLEAVLADPRCQGAKSQAIRYELGLLYEAEAQWEKAASTFKSIPSFHDVPQRLESLKGRRQSAQRTSGIPR
jgi:tetratricopeptide (TPR) repeat protein